MPVRVTFRFNTHTGQVEEFLIDDGDQRLSEQEHDRIALRVGQLVARHPVLEEVRPGAAATTTTEHDHAESATDAEEILE